MRVYPSSDIFMFVVNFYNMGNCCEDDHRFKAVISADLALCFNRYMAVVKHIRATNLFREPSN